MNTKDKGNIAEVAVLKDLLQKGYCVLEPYGDNEQFDLVAYKDGSFTKIQVKYGNVKDNVKVEFKTARQVHNTKVNKTLSYTDIDCFAGYCPANDNVYYFNTDYKSMITIRFIPSKNNQITGINWHEDFMDLPMLP